MGTRCHIFIKLKKEDKDKAHKIDLNKLPLAHHISPELIQEVYIKKDTNYMGIYNSLEGYPDGVGKVLYEKFNTYEDALNLILGGNTINITGDYWDPYLSKSMGWGFDEPSQIFEITKNPAGAIEYIYLFDGQWWFSNTGSSYLDLVKNGKVVLTAGDTSWISLGWYLKLEK